jgi:glycopeptide antibiotics resistance protein
MRLKNETRLNKLTFALFVIYLIALTWIILFKMHFNIASLSNVNLRRINLIPFAGSLIVNGRVGISEIILNVIIFIPFGIYISILGNKWGIIKKIIPVFAVSLIYETLQYIFSIGMSDITDLLGNTLGGVIGIGLFSGASKIFKEKTIKIFNILALIGTVSAVGVFGALIITNI